jgi:hypothetical protein
MFANTQRKGTDFASPDVCLTPPVPVPIGYPNFGDGPMGINPVPNVLIDGGMAHNLSTKLASTHGDEPGAAGGVGSGTVTGQSWHTAGASTVLVGGAPLTRLTSPTLQNNGNVAGARVVPSQTIVLVLAG